LKEAQAKYGVHYVYFAVDVMSRTYLERLSDAIDEPGLDIRWSAELRMEKSFPPNAARKWQKPGVFVFPLEWNLAIRGLSI
jgi:hypothetical protein